MALTITTFRRQLFKLADSALQGEPLSFVHRGIRFNVIPDVKPDLFDRITPLQVINPDHPDLDTQQLKEEMAQAWERDWSDL